MITLNFLKNRKKLFFLFLCVSFTCFPICAQRESLIENKTPVFGLSTNLLYDATTSMNLGLEFRLSDKWTFKLPATYNPWTFSDNKKAKFILAQPELRWWFCESFSGHFIGLHGHYAYFNIGGVGTNYMKKYRFEGDLYGGGLTYGYNFYLSPRWSLELALGVGYARINYDQYHCETCGEFIKTETKDYIGPTQAAISLIYLIK